MLLQKNMKKVKHGAFLVGPFIGEISWEFYQFAPYIIHLKKEHPTKKIIVLTRPSRFDLYGSYADILIPMKIPNDGKDNQKCFTIKGFTQHEYNLLARSYKKQYRDRFNIIDHICPDISIFYYKLRWQFSRTLMDYDFKPRYENKKIIEQFLCSYDMLFDTSGLYFDKDNTNIKDIKELTFQYNDFINDSDSSMLGCLIESIKMCKCVISNLTSNVARLALLLKTPLIAINECATDDEIHLINPYNTPVIRSSTVEEGIKIYESM